MPDELTDKCCNQCYLFYPSILFIAFLPMTLKNMYMQIFKYKKQYQYIINTIGKIVPCFNVSHDVFQYALS